MDLSAILGLFVGYALDAVLGDAFVKSYKELSISISHLSRKDKYPAKVGTRFCGYGGFGLERVAGGDLLLDRLQGFVDLVEGLDGEEELVHLVDLDRGVEDGFEGEVFYLAVAFQDVSAFAVGADEAAAVDADAAVLADEAELDGVPEEAAYALKHGFGGGAGLGRCGLGIGFVFVAGAVGVDDAGAELAVVG